MTAQYRNAALTRRIAILLVILLAAGLRFHHLEAQSLWNDEGATVAMIHRPPDAILANTAADIHPPGYYLLLKGWAALAGESEFALRAFSALAGILTVALAYALGRRLFGGMAGLWAALLLAVNTFALFYAQEARMYAQLGLLATTSMWVFVGWLAAWERSVKRLPGRRQLLALALINAAGLYTQYAYPFTMLAQGIVFLLWLGGRLLRRRAGRDVHLSLIRIVGLYTAANVVTLALFLPWLDEAIRQVTGWPNGGQDAGPITVATTLVYGQTARGGVSWVAVFGALILAAAGLWLYRARPLLVLPVVWAALPTGAFLLLRLQPDDMKQLLPAVSAVALWLGAGAAALWRDNCLTPRLLAMAGTAILAITLVTGLPPFYHDAGFARDDYRAMAARITADPRPGDAIILDGPGQGEVWSYYYEGEAPVYALPWGGDEATRATLDTILQERERIFVLFWGDMEQDPRQLVESALDAGAFEVGSQWYGNVRFVTYATGSGTASGAPDEILDARFGDHIVLHGYALDRTTYQPGDVVTLTLFWTTETALDIRYKVFVHLYAAAGDPPLAQHDGEPGGGQAWTTTWQPGDIIIDRHGVPIPQDLPPGTYLLGVGLYDGRDPNARLSAAQGERLPLLTLDLNG